MHGELPPRNSEQVRADRGRTPHAVHLANAKLERPLREVLRRPARVELEVAEYGAVVRSQQRLGSTGVSRSPGPQPLFGIRHAGRTIAARYAPKSACYGANVRVGMKAWNLPLLMLVGCPDPGDYACVDDADCDRGGQFGQCLADRACAYPVPTERCPSGLIRSPNAATDPGGCVPEDGTGSSSSTGLDSTSTTGATTTGGACDDPQVVEVGLELEALAGAGPGYPLLIQLAADDVVAALRAHGSDLVVTSADGTTLPTEWMLGEDGEPVQAWIKLPDPGEQTVQPLRIRWDEPGPAPTEVWSDFAFVWHFDDASNLDATRAKPFGDLEGSPLPAQAVDAIVGNGLQFDGLDDVLRVDPAPARDAGPFTISVWARYDDPSDERAEYFSSLGGHSLYPRCYRNGEGRVSCQLLDGEQSDNLGGPDHPRGSFRHVALVREGDDVRLYVDGSVEANATSSDGNIGSGREPLRIADGQWGPAMVTLDELRYADRATSEAWIAFDAQTHRDPGSVVTAASLRCD